MSKFVNVLPNVLPNVLSSVQLTDGRWTKWVVALLLAAAISAMPLVSPATTGPFQNLLAQPVHAGCQQGGSCG